MATHRAVEPDASRQINTLSAFIFGAVFVVVGLLGFTVSGGHDPAGRHGGHLIGVFGVNMLHNLVHLALGALMIIAAVAGTQAARAMNFLVGLAYLAVGGLGLFAVDSNANIIALNAADNGLHLALGVLLIAIGYLGDRA